MPLATPRGMNTRPTTDKIKETLFNMLQGYVEDGVFIDLFSGSGGIGIEALSRGARHAYFVENDVSCIKCINENLKFTKMEEQATVLRQDAVNALGLIHEKEADIIFADPPYKSGYEEALLKTLGRCLFVTEDTIVIIEADMDTDFEFADECGFDIIKEKCYKTNKHVWLMKRDEK